MLLPRHPICKRIERLFQAIALLRVNSTACPFDRLSSTSNPPPGRPVKTMSTSSKALTTFAPKRARSRDGQRSLDSSPSSRTAGPGERHEGIDVPAFLRQTSAGEGPFNYLLDLRGADLHMLNFNRDPCQVSRLGSAAAVAHRTRPVRSIIKMGTESYTPHQTTKSIFKYTAMGQIADLS